MTELICSTKGCEREISRHGKCLHHHVEELYEMLDFLYSHSHHYFECSGNHGKECDCGLDDVLVRLVEVLPDNEDD